MPILLNNASATGPWADWNGGTGVFSCVGTFAGATVTLQFQGPDGSTAITVGTNTTLTAAGGGGFVLPPGQIRALVTGSPSGMYAQAEKVR
jgi:hypothetical protein